MERRAAASFCSALPWDGLARARNWSAPRFFWHRMPPVSSPASALLWTAAFWHRGLISRRRATATTLPSRSPKTRFQQLAPPPPPLAQTGSSSFLTQIGGRHRLGRKNKNRKKTPSTLLV